MFQWVDATLVNYGRSYWVVRVDKTDPYIVTQDAENQYVIRLYGEGKVICGGFKTLDAAKAAYLLLLED